MRPLARMMFVAMAFGVGVLSFVGCPGGTGSAGWIFELGYGDKGEGIFPAEVGGYFISGQSALVDDPTSEYVVLASRVSAQGALLWAELIDGLYMDRHSRLGVPVSASEFVIVGSDMPEVREESHLRLLKFDAYGNVLWDLTYGPGLLEPQAVVSSEDGGCVVASKQTLYSWSAASKSYTYLSQVQLRKVDSDGAIVWDQYHETPSGVAGIEAMDQTHDGGYVLTGFRSETLKVDASGQLEWSNLYDELFFAYAVDQATDNGFVIFGEFGPSPYVPAVIRTDADGNLLWKKTNIMARGGGVSYSVRDGLVDTEGRIVMVGQASSIRYVGPIPISSYSGFILQLDVEGNLNWMKTIDAAWEINGIALTFNGDYMTTGTDGNHTQVLCIDTHGNVR